MSANVNLKFWWIRNSIFRWVQKYIVTVFLINNVICDIVLQLVCFYYLGHVLIFEVLKNVLVIQGESTDLWGGKGIYKEFSFFSKTFQTYEEQENTLNAIRTQGVGSSWEWPIWDWIVSGYDWGQYTWESQLSGASRPHGLYHRWNLIWNGFFTESLPDLDLHFKNGF